MHPTAQISIACGRSECSLEYQRNVETHLGVHLEGEHDLGRAVPARRDILGHDTGLFARGARRARAPREPKVAHLQVTIRVQEQVRGLQVAVDDVRAVHRLQRAQRLVYEVLRMGARSVRRRRCVFEGERRTWQ